MVAGGGVPRVVAMEEQKKKWAGAGVGMELRVPKLKFTAHALENFGVSMLSIKIQGRMISEEHNWGRNLYWQYQHALHNESKKYNLGEGCLL